MMVEQGQWRLRSSGSAAARVPRRVTYVELGHMATIKDQDTVVVTDRVDTMSDAKQSRLGKLGLYR
jgi:hypothetical protein